MKAGIGQDDHPSVVVFQQVSESLVVSVAKGYHGNDVLHDTIRGYDRTLQRGQTSHTVGDITVALEKLASADDGMYIDLNQTLIGLVSDSILDALMSILTASFRRSFGQCETCRNTNPPLKTSDA